MAGKRFKDFDAFWSEQTHEPVTIKVFGKEYTLPNQLPASIMLYTFRAQQAGGKDAEIGAEIIFKMAEGLFGQAQLDEIVAKGLSVEQLGELIRGTIELYQGGTEEETPTTPPEETTGV